jgi:hypothetical protein
MLITEAGNGSNPVEYGQDVRSFAVFAYLSFETTSDGWTLTILSCLRRSLRVYGLLPPIDKPTSSTSLFVGITADNASVNVSKVGNEQLTNMFYLEAEGNSWEELGMDERKGFA